MPLINRKKVYLKASHLGANLVNDLWSIKEHDSVSFIQLPVTILLKTYITISLTLILNEIITIRNKRVAEVGYGFLQVYKGQLGLRTQHSFQHLPPLIWCSNNERPREPDMQGFLKCNHKQLNPHTQIRLF